MALRIHDQCYFSKKVIGFEPRYNWSEGETNGIVGPSHWLPLKVSERGREREKKKKKRERERERKRERKREREKERKRERERERERERFARGYILNFGATDNHIHRDCFSCLPIYLR